MPLEATLSWELPRNDGQVSQGAQPERNATMSQPLYSEVTQAWPVIKTATDLKSIIPNLDSISENQAITCFCELMSTVAEYESSWDPNCISVDVEGRKEPEYLATGLFQMNAAEDQANYHTGTNFDHEELFSPAANIQVAVAILVYLVEVRGKITYAKGEHNPIISYFFATLLTDGKVGPSVIAAAKARIAGFGFNG